MQSNPETNDVLDDLFHGSALAAFVDEMVEARAFPCPDATKADFARNIDSAF